MKVNPRHALADLPGPLTHNSSSSTDLPLARSRNEGQPGRERIRWDAHEGRTMPTRARTNKPSGADATRHALADLPGPFFPRMIM